MQLQLLLFCVKKNIPAYVSKHNSSCETQVILSMIPNVQKWHYLAIKIKLPALLRGVTSKHYSYIYCLNCLNSFRAKNKLKSHKVYVKIKIFVIWLCCPKRLKCQNLINIKYLIKHHFYLRRSCKSKRTYSIRFFNVYNMII